MNKKLEKKKKKAAERNKKQQLFRDRPHSCGDCYACCFLFEQGDKPAKAMCAYIREGGGCDCYETRPQLCRDYKCTWLRNKKLAANLRPDRCGFIITPRGYYKEYELLTIEEMTDKGMDALLYKHVVDWLIRIKAIIVVVRHGGEKVVHYKHCGLVDSKAILDHLFHGFDQDRESQNEDLAGFSFVKK
ncbi:MAG: hypothetical protein M0R80_02630 [Proteobacteria bacterium]|jgi:hypothetical protein|nr:hypothetical protein [Pseudomonadota bacterium]